MKSIKTKIRGVNQSNEDGKSRQDLIWELVEPGDYLGLEREPHNPFDPNAIAVLVVNGDTKKIGYLSKELAVKISPLLDTQYRVLCQVLEVTGGDEDKSFGVNVELEIYSPNETSEINKKMKSRLANTSVTTVRGVPPKIENRTIPLWLPVVVLFMLLFTFFVGSLKGTDSISSQLLTPLGMEPKSPVATHTPQSLLEAFKAMGLEAENPQVMTRDEYGLAPMYATEAVRFFIPSLCEDCGGRIFMFDPRDQEGLEKTRIYYDKMGKESALFFSWVFVKDNILVQINGELPEELAKKYEAALNQN